MRTLSVLSSVAVVCAMLLLSGCASSGKLGYIDDLIAQGQYRDAANEYLRVIQEKPGTTMAREAMLGIGTLYEENLGRSDDALQTYRDLADRYTATPEAQEALWRLGMYHMEREEFPQAMPWFMQLVMDAPRSERATDAQLQRAVCYTQMQRPQEALMLYDSFLRQSPTSPRVPEILLQQALLYETHLDRRDQAIVAYKRLTDEFAQTPQAQVASGRLNDLNAIAEPGPELPEEGLRDIGPPTRPGARQTLMSWGPSEVFGFNARELILGGQGVFGGEELQESLAGNGALLDDTVLNMGIMFVMMDEYSKAGACLERAAELGLEDTNLFLNLGISYREVGAVSQARAAFQRLHALDPTAIGRLLMQADRLFVEGETDAAQRRYESLNGVSPEHDETIQRRLRKIAEKD